MEFLVIAMDGTDEGALDRRTGARKKHIAGIKALMDQGHFIAGGAILDDADNMIGSTLILDFLDRESVELCLADDPYTKGNVWQDVSIRPFRAVR